MVQRYKDVPTYHVIATRRDCEPSDVATAIAHASKTKAEMWVGRLTEHTGRATAGAKLNNARQRLRELVVEYENMNRRLVKSNAIVVETKQQVGQLLAVMVGNYKKAYALENRRGTTWRHLESEL